LVAAALAVVLVMAYRNKHKFHTRSRAISAGAALSRRQTTRKQTSMGDMAAQEWRETATKQDGRFTINGISLSGTGQWYEMEERVGKDSRVNTGVYVNWLYQPDASSSHAG
jgi:hypothetical protein